MANGSRAGLEAPLQVGYYMIGRHAECQIRPKSKSVSRRHCILHLDDQALKVMDLRSTSGTTLNGKKIRSGKWRELADSDSLRLGKILFEVRLAQTQTKPSTQERHNKPEEGRSVPDASVASVTGVAEDSDFSDNDSADGDSPESMVSGEAWDTFDVASFLDDADQKDQQDRYEKIRSESKQRDEQLDQSFDTIPESNLFDDSDDEQDSDDGQNVEEPKTSSRRNGTDHSTSSSKTKSPGKKLPSWMSVNTVLSLGDDGNPAKLVFAIVIAIAVLSFAGYKAYQFSSGPPVRVMNEID